MPEDATVTVLVVNDNEVQNNVLTRMLEQEGFLVLRAFSGREALMEAKKNPQMILMDVKISDMGGFDVCRLLKEDAATTKIPVVFITATYQYSFAHDESAKAGGEGFLFYPVESDQ